MAKLSPPQQEAIAAIRARFAAGVSGRVRAIEAGAALLQRRGPRPDLVDHLFRDAHGLAGSAGIFGFRDLAEACAALEMLLSAPPPAPAEEAGWKQRIARATERVRRAAGGGGSIDGQSAGASRISGRFRR